MGDPFAVRLKVAGSACLAVCCINNLAASVKLSFAVLESTALAAGTVIEGSVSCMVQSADAARWLWDSTTAGSVKASGKGIVLLDPEVVPRHAVQPQVAARDWHRCYSISSDVCLQPRAAAGPARTA